MNCQLSLPKEIRFGRGERHGLTDSLPAGPVLIAAGKHAKARIEEELLPRLAGREVRLISDIQAEPPLGEVERLLAAGREIGATSVVGWGGGSAIDAAKTAAALLPLPGAAADYFFERRAIPGKGVFFAALPTTAGTGAEITPNAVLTDSGSGIKKSIRHPGMFADLAIVDPELTYDCPPAVMAASGFDALTQGIESYLSRKATPASQALALGAVRKLLPLLAPAVEGDLPMRDSVAEGSMLAAMAFVQSGLGAVHGIGHPLGAACDVPHGVVCAVLLPEILRRNLPDCRDEMAELAFWSVRGEPETLIRILEKVREAIKLPADFKGYGLSPRHYAFIVSNCRSGSMKTNPHDFTDQEVVEILEALS